MKTEDIDEILAILVSNGFPSGVAREVVRLIASQPGSERNAELLSAIRNNPSELVAAARAAAQEMFGGDWQEFVLPAVVVARHEDGTYDLEFDFESEYSKVLRRNHEALAQLLGIEYKKGVRFCGVPGVEGFPIAKSQTTATIGFKDADLSKPYAKPPLVILGGMAPLHPASETKIDPPDPADSN